VLGLAVAFSLLDAGTSTIMIFFRGVGFEANINVHQVYPTFGALSPLVDVPIEVAGVFIVSIFMLWGARSLLRRISEYDLISLRLGIGIVFGLGDIILLTPIIVGVVGNVAATIVGSTTLIFIPYVIFTNTAQFFLLLRNIVNRKSVLAGDWGHDYDSHRALTLEIRGQKP